MPPNSSIVILPSCASTPCHAISSLCLAQCRTLPPKHRRQNRRSRHILQLDSGKRSKRCEESSGKTPKASHCSSASWTCSACYQSWNAPPRTESPFHAHRNLPAIRHQNLLILDYVADKPPLCAFPFPFLFVSTALLNPTACFNATDPIEIHHCCIAYSSSSRPTHSTSDPGIDVVGPLPKCRKLAAKTKKYTKVTKH